MTDPIDDDGSIRVEGPYFEDFEVGEDFSDVPAVTLTDGHVAFYQAVFGDRLSLPLDHELCKRVTGSDRALVNPSLIANFAIGQSTFASQRVMGNLFYRGLCFQTPVFVGDTLTTRTRVVALKQNKTKQGRAASGMVGLEIHTTNQNGETALKFWRCPMIPCRDPKAVTGKDDDLSFIPENLEGLEDTVPQWDLAEFRSYINKNDSKTSGTKTSGAKRSYIKRCYADELEPGQSILLDARDTVTSAPELVRMTLNMAMTHTDANRSVYGKRLVYGGHTISLAASQLSRALPDMVVTLAWHKCAHTAPVFEGDILQSRIGVLGRCPLKAGSIVDLKLEVFATRGDQAPEPGSGVKVLDWHLAALFA